MMSRILKNRNKMVIGIVLAVLICYIFFSVTTITASAEVPEKKAYYTSIKIETGDTLWSIAEEYCGSADNKDIQEYVDRVAAMNHIDRKGTIYAGNYITIIYYK